MKNKLKVLLSLLAVCSVLGATTACGLLQSGDSSKSESSNVSESVNESSDDTSSDTASDTSSDSTPDSSVVAPTTYTVTFVADGQEVGTATYTAENTEITEPEVPAKAHYTGAWEAYELTTGDVTVNAVYTAVEYTVTFKADDAEVGTVTYTVEDTEITEPEVPEKECYAGVWEEYTLDGGDITVNAVYTYVGYTVKFVDEDGTEISTGDYELGDEVTVPADPEKAADGEYTYTFAGWDKDVTVVEGNATYTATYTKTPITYTVTFKADGAEDVVREYNVENKGIEVPEVPAKTGYTAAWEAYELTTGNITVNAVYTAIEYTVTFMSGEDVVATEIFTIENAEITVPEVPAKTGYSGGEWSAYDLSLLENQTATAINYTANTYKITYDAGNGTCEATEQEVTYDAEYTLATATAPKSYQEHLGWADEYGNKVENATWNIASNVTLTAIYSEGVVFDTLSEVPSYMTKTSQTASLSIVELNGNKVLKMTGSETGTNHGLNVTLDFLTEVFADENVEYLAFDVKSETTQHTNFRRSTIRTTGTIGSWGQEPYEADVQADGMHITGYRPDAFKTFFFSRTDYNNWVENDKTVEMLISAGNLAAGESLYVDNIRPVTQAQYNAVNYSLETGGIRLNGGNLLVYYANTGSTWQYAITADTVDESRCTFSDFGFTNENVTEGKRALVFTKTAGQVTMRFNSTTVANFIAIANTTGYYAFDLYVSAESDAIITYPNMTNSALLGHEPNKGGWMTIYCQNDTNVSIKLTDTTGGTYMMDNFRSVTAEEFTAAQYGFEAGTVGLRTNLLNDENTVSGAAYIYNKGNDYKGVKASMNMLEGNGAGDANAISNVRLTNEVVHSGSSSLAFDKGSGYVSFGRHSESEAKQNFAGGFTLWIYSTVEIDGVNANQITNGVNGKVGGEGIIIPANTWTQITLAADEISEDGRFMIIQGSIEGTIYLDDFCPLSAE